MLDRTELILDIFASRAQTHEARLAVELAQLRVLAAAAQADVDPLVAHQDGHRHARPWRKAARSRPPARREADSATCKRRARQDRSAARSAKSPRRSDRMTVSLVGYTNAGKSTLLNALTGADVLAEDKLFATLDTRTRRWQLPGWGPVLLSDTVGFIRDLPHHLIASFKATLEEARQADLLLHVADASNPAALDQITAVYDVLEELGIEEKDTLLVLNKSIESASRACSTTCSATIPIRDPDQRARRGEGLTRLATTVSNALTQHFLDVDVETDVANGRLLAYLAQHGEILSRTFTDDRVSVHCRLPRKYAGRIRPDEAVIHLARRASSTKWQRPRLFQRRRHPAESTIEDVA